MPSNTNRNGGDSSHGNSGGETKEELDLVQDRLTNFATPEKVLLFLVAQLDHDLLTHLQRKQTPGRTRYKQWMVVVMMMVHTAADVLLLLLLSFFAAWLPRWVTCCIRCIKPRPPFYPTTPPPSPPPRTTVCFIPKWCPPCTAPNICGGNIPCGSRKRKQGNNGNNGGGNRATWGKSHNQPVGNSMCAGTVF
jgi:hypothetical protein